MKLTGYFAVILCTVLAVYGQEETTSAIVEPNEATTVAVPDTPAPQTATKHVVETTNVPAAESTITPAPESTTSSAPESTTSPAPESTTSPAPESTTSPAPESTTTGQESTTTPAQESTTTPGPEPTTTPHTPIPTSTVAPSEDLSLYVNNSGSVCILMNMEVTLTIEYENGTGVNVTGEYKLKDGDVIVNETKSSNCSGAGGSEEQLVASVKGNNELFILFNLTDNKVSINLIKLTFSALQNIFPDAKSKNITLESEQKLFEYSKSKSYKCDAEAKVTLKDEMGRDTKSYVTFKEVKVQAFRTESDANFATAEDCVQDDNVSDIVPIAVGCALAALVVIVLIAYLVGRRQKRQRGYESV